MKHFLLIITALLAICCRAHAAAVTGAPGDNFQTDLNNAAGGTLTLPAGTYSISGTVWIHSGTTIIGDAGGGTHIKFALPAASYGFEVDGNAANVSLVNLDVVSSNGIVSMRNGQKYQSIHVTNCRLEYGAGTLPDGTLVYGMTGTIPNVDTQITHNYFHDSPNTVRNWCFFCSSASNFDYNTFYNITDGGQLEYMGANDSFSYNYGTYLHRMGQETAGSATTVDFEVIGNVFYDYVSPCNDSEGVSICIYGAGTKIAGNYFDANFAPGSSWGQQSGAAAGGPNRFGYAIEASGVPATVSGNTLIGVWAEQISCMSTGIVVSGNNIFGTSLWGDIAGEPGPAGPGSANASNNSIDTNIADAPPPPANTNSYLGSAPVTVSQGNGSIARVAGNTLTLGAVPSASGVTLIWTQQLTNVQIHTFTPHDDCGVLSESGPASGAMLSGLNGGWGYQDDVSGLLNGQTWTGNVKFTTIGSSPNGTTAALATFAPAPKLITKTVQTVINTSVYNPLGTPGPVTSASSTVQTFSDGTTATTRP
jgi:hypothetical protein